MEKYYSEGQEMLETPKERVQLLKAGIPGKTIEQLYVVYNNFKVVQTPVCFELVEIDKIITPLQHEVIAGYAQAFSIKQVTPANRSR